MSNWALFKRMICCNSTNPLKQYDPIWKCINCGGGFHESCLEHPDACKTVVPRFASENQMAIELAKEIE